MSLRHFSEWDVLLTRTYPSRRGRNEHEGHQASFLEFKTGARHPLSLVHPVVLPIHPIFDCEKPEVEVLGDYILVTAIHEMLDRSAFSVVSWKTGSATQVSGTFHCHPNF